LKKCYFIIIQGIFGGGSSCQDFIDLSRTLKFPLQIEYMTNATNNINKSQNEQTELFKAKTATLFSILTAIANDGDTAALCLISYFY